MVRNCQLSDLIYLTAPARAGAAEGVSVRERVGEPEWAQRTLALQAPPLAPGPHRGREKVLPGPVGTSLKRALHPTHLLPPHRML